MQFNKIVIIGMGLIGGSIGKAAMAKGLAKEIIGICRRRSSLDRAVKERSLTKGFVDDYTEAVKGADLIVIATPVFTVMDILDKLSGSVSGDVIVTDAGSTKKDIVGRAAAHKDKYSFVGAHPLAGSDKVGVEFSSAELFEGSPCILTPSGDADPSDVDTVKGFWEGLGANVSIVSAGEHDSIVAFTSHMPHIAAYALAGLQPKDFLKYVSTGFKDTCRIAGSDPELWSEIFLSNPGNVLSVMDQYVSAIGSISECIKNKDRVKLVEILTKCKEVMDALK